MDTGGEHTGQAEGSGERAGQTGEQVVLVYRLTLADLRGAARIRARRTAAGRLEALLILLLPPAVMVGLGVFRGSDPAATTISTVITTGIAVVALGWARRSTVRQAYAAAERYGQCRTVVDELGAATTGEIEAVTVDWTGFPAYAETPELFVLFGGRRESAVQVLPKRGVRAPADVGRLRAVLERNLRRI
ncbi:hypothetical protein [Streptomyces sp. NPDC056491]|uniref:hypothetical protein n=1 Tax=Streptomyces sp. NPDC056491 TaxID=3345837 RepID=UPI0036860A14